MGFLSALLRDDQRFRGDWFEDGLAASAPGLFHHKQILTPSVHFSVDFPKPTRYGDRLTFNLWTSKVGRTSCEFTLRHRTTANFA